MRNPEIVAAFAPVAKVLEDLGVSYYIGGSVASSAYGIARATLDVDIVANLRFIHVNDFTERLSPTYYLDKEMIVDAIRRGSSFNLVHLESMVKVDVFIAQEKSFQQETFKRKRKDKLDDTEGAQEFYFATAEDNLLSKLEWFQREKGMSEQQWRDVIGIIRVQGERLDRTYLRRWAKELGLSDLLVKAFDDAGG